MATRETGVTGKGRPGAWRYVRAESEIVVAAFRLAFTLLVLISPLFGFAPGGWGGELRLSAILVAVYSAAVPVMYWRRWGFRGQRQVTLGIDLLLVTMWLYMARDTGPRISSLYYGLVAVAALWFGMTGALAAAVAAGVLYGGAVAIWPAGLEPLAEVLGWRIPVLFLVALLVGYTVEAQNRERAGRDEAAKGDRELAQRGALLDEIYEDLVVKPAHRELRGMEVGLRCRQAWHYGAGDYYDIIELGGKTLVVVGDVAGTYSPGLKRVLQLKYSILAAAHMFESPSRMLTWLNRVLYPELQPDQFVSFCCALIDREEGSLVYANAGHETPVLVRGATKQVERLEQAGMVLGVLPETSYEDVRVEFGRGDVLLLYTDGVTGATSASGDEFGLRRTEMAALSAATLSPSADKIAEGVFADVRLFSERGPRQDDVTVLAVRLVDGKEQA